MLANSAMRAFRLTIVGPASDCGLTHPVPIGPSSTVELVAHDTLAFRADWRRPLAR